MSNFNFAMNSQKGREAVINSTIVKSVEALENVALTAKDGQKCYLDDGGRSGNFTMRSARRDENDGGTIFNGMERDNILYITPDMFGAKGDYYLPDGSINPNNTNNTQYFSNLFSSCRKSNLLYGRYGAKYNIVIPDGNYGIDYLDLSGFSGFNIFGSSKNNSRIIAREGWLGITNNNNDKCFILINPFYGDDSSDDYATSSSSSYFSIKNLNIKEAVLTTNSSAVGMYITRASQYTIDNISLSGFGSTMKLIHTWIGTISNSTIRNGYANNLNLGEVGQLNGITFNNVDFTSGDIQLGTDNSNIRYGNNVNRVELLNCYYEGKHEIAIISDGENTIKIHGGSAEYYGKVFCYFKAQNSTLDLTAFTAPNTILCNSDDGVMFTLNTRGGDLSGCTIKGNLNHCNSSGFIGNGGNVILDIVPSYYYRNFILELDAKNKMTSHNIMEVSLSKYHVYDSFSNTNATNTIFIPKIFENKKFLIKLKSRPSSQEYEFNSTVEEATFTYKGDETSETSLAKIYEIGSSDTELTMTFKENTGGAFTFWLNDVASGYVHASFIVEVIFTDIDI